MIKKIEIHEFVEGKPHGDRATTMTPCSTFHVQVFRDGVEKPFTSFTYHCFDPFMVHVKDRAPGLKAAREHAKGLASAIGYTKPIKLRAFREKLVSKRSWVEA
jgi:hypothetical protein